MHPHIDCMDPYIDRMNPYINRMNPHTNRMNPHINRMNAHISKNCISWTTWHSDNGFLYPAYAYAAAFKNTGHGYVLFMRGKQTIVGNSDIGEIWKEKLIIYHYKVL
jgi:hypothetical protein